MRRINHLKSSLYIFSFIAVVFCLFFFFKDILIVKFFYLLFFNVLFLNFFCDGINC